jgi:hypothetical protein
MLFFLDPEMLRAEAASLAMDKCRGHRRSQRYHTPDKDK